MMAYTLDEFCNECRDLLTSASVPECLPKIADKLRQLLGNNAFVESTFSDDTSLGRRLLHHDPVTGFYVYAHVQQAGKGGSPHSHGESWAIYGNARGYTEMTEWQRVNPETEDHAVLRKANSYHIGPCQTRDYGPGVIHSTAHPEKAWVIRVTGADLDSIPRYHFRPKKDKILESA